MATGQMFPDQSVCNNDEIARVLYIVLNSRMWISKRLAGLREEGNMSQPIAEWDRLKASDGKSVLKDSRMSSCRKIGC